MQSLFQINQRTYILMEKELEYFIHVEYCINCHSHSWCTHHNQAKYHETFIKLKNLIYEEFKQQKQKIKITSNQVPQHYLPIKQQQNKYYDSKNKKYIFYPNIGAFNVSINGQNIFQKKKDNSWPSFDNILNLLYFKIKNKQRINDLSKNQRNITSQNQIYFEPENNKMQQRTLYKQKSSSHNKDFSLTNHFKTYHTQGSSTTICNEQTKNLILKKNKQPLNSSRLKINVQNIQKLKEALQHNQINQNYKVCNAQKGKHKQILINLSSIEQQNGQQNVLNCNLKKVQCQLRSQNKIISEKSLSRKKLQQWQTDLNLAEDKFSKIQNKVSVERISKIPYLQLEINENPNQQLQTNLNSSLREEANCQKYNKKNAQSFHDHPISLFQNLHSSRFKQLNLQEQDYINWKSHENITKSKKIQQIETYIKANQQYKNQQLRKIYGNWKIQGTYSKHLNFDNQKKQSIFKIKKNKNVKILNTNKKNNVIHQNQNLKPNQQYLNDQISEDNESSSSTVHLKHKINIGNSFQKHQIIQANQSLYQRHKNIKKPRNTADRFSKQNQLIQNKKQSKSLMKINQINNFNKLKYHKVNQKIQQRDKNSKGQYDKAKLNAIEMGQKKLNGKMINSTKNYHKPLLFKQVKSFHFQNKKYQKQNNSPQKLRMVTTKISVSKNIADNKQNIQKKSLYKDKKENFELLKKEGFYCIKSLQQDDIYKKSLQQDDIYKIKSKNKKKQKILASKNQQQTLENTKIKQKLPQHLQENIISFQANMQKEAEFQNKQDTFILNKQQKKNKQTTKISKSSRLSLSKNQVNIFLEKFSNKQIIQNKQKQDKTLSQKTSQIAYKQNDYTKTQLNNKEQKNQQSNNVFQEKFNLNQMNQIDQIEDKTQINENSNLPKNNKTHKKSKFSEDLKEQEHQNTNQYKIDLKEMNQNSQRQNLIRSQSCNESLIDKQQKQPCKCTLRLQQSHRRKCESQQKSILKHRQNEKRYIQTKRRRQQLQKKREQYLRERQLSKHNKISKNNSQSKSRVKSYVTNILNQRQDQQNDKKKSRVIIQNKKKRKQYKKQKYHKQHSKTIDFQIKKQKKQRTQFQQGWYTIFSENNSPQSILNKSYRQKLEPSKSYRQNLEQDKSYRQNLELDKSYRQNASKFINSKKNKKNSKIKKQKNFKKYYQTTAIQTTCLNQASVQTELINMQFDDDKMIESDNLNKCVNSSREKDQTRKSRYCEYVNNQNNKQQCRNDSNGNNKNCLENSNIKMSSQINVKIQGNEIIQIERMSERVHVRSQAQILRQLYGQQIQKQKQRYQSMLKNNKIFGIQQQKESQNGEQFQLKSATQMCIQLKSATQIYNMNLKLFENKLNLNGFKSNCEENINFMKTTLMLANKNELLIVRLFQDYKQNINYKKKQKFNTSNRLYGVWICVNYRWKIILVNDVIPVIFQNQTNSYKPLFCQPLNQCIWPLILEKAILVASGGYTNYLKLSCGQIFHMLTGSNYIDFNINQDLDKNKQFLKYISQNQRKNYIIYCEKNLKNIKQQENNISQIKVFCIISKKIVNDQQILFKMQELSNDQNQLKTQVEPYYIKYQRFCQSFKSCEILHLRQNHNYFQVYLSHNDKLNNEKCNKFFFVAQLSFQEEAFGCITISNKYRGYLKSYLYRQQNNDTQLLKLVGQASKNNKKQLFFDCCFHSCKYLLFVQTQHDDSTLTYLGQGRPNIIIKEQISQNGLKNNITQYLPVSLNNNGKINQFTRSGQFLGRSRMTNLDKTDSNNINTSKGFQQLRQKFIQLIIKGKNNG